MKLKHHEKKLLRKVDFLEWKKANTLREAHVLRRYHVSAREDYVKYNKIVGMVTSLASKLKSLKQDDPQRIQVSELLLRKLYAMGLVDSEKSLAKADRVTVSAFCRRRLPVVMVRLKMAQTVREAVGLVEAGNVRVGPHPVTDPAFLVTRAAEDHVTWVDHSHVKRHIARYNDKLDDYDLLRL
ncbi:hypothetical protein CTAYLR_006991 [Chrysophaeum taylorii]|uniref:U3 small nucleolar ribonucleoprotein protein IMP3 n=1 Tax=Chrysophaeum taylorii TaxID=2483200 RepID=A0AAD7U9Q3_9STRA|nr:hypothetical protein CTAYLR_006991 [Chrysophaeum taylorii]